MRHAKECARLEPQKGYPFWFMGVIFKDLGRNPAAHEAFEEALKRDLTKEQSAAVHERLAEVLVHLKEYAQALNILAESRRRSSRSPSSWPAVRNACGDWTELGKPPLLGEGSAGTSANTGPPPPPRRYLNDNEPQKAAASSSVLFRSTAMILKVGTS